jgi:ADP-ribose pyrophosphatase YjhB (NUDIX family)
VAALIRLEGGLVLVRHRKGTATYHLLPGGGVDFGETLSDALSREVREETGLAIQVGDILFVNDTIDPDGKRHVVNLTFEARPVGGELTDTPDDARVEAVEVVAPDRLGSFDLRPPISEAIVAYLRDGSTRPAYLGSLFTPDRENGQR